MIKMIRTINLLTSQDVSEIFNVQFWKKRFMIGQAIAWSNDDIGTTIW